MKRVLLTTALILGLGLAVALFTSSLAQMGETKNPKRVVKDPRGGPVLNCHVVFSDEVCRGFKLGSKCKKEKKKGKCATDGAPLGGVDPNCQCIPVD